MIIGISGLGFFGPKMAVSGRTSVFQKKNLAEPPIFIVLFGCAFLGQGVKKGNFGHPPTEKKTLTDN